MNRPIFPRKPLLLGFLAIGHVAGCGGGPPVTSSDNGTDGAGTRSGLPGATANPVAEAGDGSLDAAGNQAANTGDAPTSFTVNGKVLDYSEAPLAGYQVAIGNQSALSASDGGFVIRGVTAPYNALITNPRDGGACVYVGLTRSDPLLALPFGKALISAQASVTVSLPVLSSNENELVYFAPALPGDVTRWGEVGSLARPSSMGWLGWDRSLPTMNGNIYVLRYSVNAGTVFPAAFTSYTALPVTVQAGDNKTITVATLGAVATGTLSATLPSRDVMLSALLRTPNDPARLRVASGVGPGMGGIVTLPVPLVPGANFFLSMAATGPARDSIVVRRGATPGRTVDFLLPSETTLATPPDLYASVDNTTVFAWSAPANQGVFDFFVQQVQFEGVRDSGCCELGYKGARNDIYEVVTASPEASLADFLAHATIFPGQMYYWGVRAYPDRTSVDDAASTHHIDWECVDSAKSPEGDATCVTTPTRRFVTK